MDNIVTEVSNNKVFGEQNDIQRGLVSTNQDPNEKIYLVLLTLIGEEEDDKRTWEMHKGRQDTYEYLRELTVSEAIDPNDSFILAETVAMQDMGTVIGFLEAMIEGNLVTEDTGFDPAFYDIIGEEENGEE